MLEVSKKTPIYHQEVLNFLNWEKKGQSLPMETYQIHGESLSEKEANVRKDERLQAS